ncbi:MAG: DNA-3-methyladenine glycosylase I [Gemmatimonadales bacterium]
MARLPDGLIVGDDGVPRCWWGASTPRYAAYHDEEWGRPIRDDRTLFEKICLEGFQAGLSWLTILNKRENFRAGFANFEIERVARLTGRDVKRLLGDAGIVRHRGKIESTINNAKQAAKLVEEHGSLANFVWRYEPGPKQRPKKMTKAALVTMNTSPESVALSKELKRRGWTFVGPTTVYAFMQAMGLVNDHLEGCPARAVALRARASLP